MVKWLRIFKDNGTMGKCRLKRRTCNGRKYYFDWNARSGKSTVGVVLAKVLGYDFIDSDLLIQAETGKRLFEIINASGIDGFLKVENEVNSRIETNHTVIATGGSVIYGEEAMAHLKSIGTVVYIQVPYADLEKRLGNLLKRGVAIRNGSTLKDLYDERVPLYEKYADITVDERDKGIREVVKTIEHMLEGSVRR